MRRSHHFAPHYPNPRQARCAPPCAARRTIHLRLPARTRRRVGASACRWPTCGVIIFIPCSTVSRSAKLSSAHALARLRPARRTVFDAARRPPLWMGARGQLNARRVLASATPVAVNVTQGGGTLRSGVTVDPLTPPLRLRAGKPRSRGRRYPPSHRALRQRPRRTLAE